MRGQPSSSRRRCDPVGVLEIGERLGVRPQTARMWRTRGLMPDPDYKVSGLAAWEWSTIERWARNTGRWHQAAESEPEF